MSPWNRLEINGWTLFAHPIFIEQLESLTVQVENLFHHAPLNYKKKNCTKRLAAISKLIFDIIPNNPTLPIYRQGNALGANYTHWFRAKFFQQYRLFFRYHLESKIIIYAWINDEVTKRAYDSKTDAYLVFTKMLNIGRPPDDWEGLLAESKTNEAQEKFCKMSIKSKHD